MCGAGDIDALVQPVKKYLISKTGEWYVEENIAHINMEYTGCNYMHPADCCYAKKEEKYAQT